MRASLLTVAWTLAALVVIDVAINLAFRYPTSRDAKPNHLQSYFEFGRSTEGKLRRMLGNDDASAPSVALAGFPLAVDTKAIVEPLPGRLGISVYGMSFTNNIADAARRIDPDVRARAYSGPAAPPNHSYAAFLRQRGRDRNPVQVLGILASSVKGLLTMSGLTWNPERPYPFTYPRYTLDAQGRLVETLPLIGSAEEMRSALRDPPRWNAFLYQLAAHDRFFSRRVVSGNALTDGSSLARLVRRADAQHGVRARSGEVSTDKGFADDPDVGPVLRAIVREFARRCRADGQLPVVLLVQDRGGAPDALWRLVGPTLVDEGIAYVSTHDVVPCTDASQFDSTGHFVPAADEKIARRLLDVIARNGVRPRPATGPATSPLRGPPNDVRPPDDGGEAPVRVR